MADNNEVRDDGRDDNYVDLADLTSQDSDRDSAVACEYLTGPAGSGKTFEIQRRMREAPGWADGGAVVASTTGISAVNLGTTTINSLLGYFDQESLEDAYAAGQITRKLNHLQEEGVHRIVLDEVSMMPGEALEIVHRAIAETQSYAAVQHGEIPSMGLTVTGDFAQLPPVKGTWAFEADCWKGFAANTTRLEKVWRQADPRFLSAMSAIRAGDGGSGAAILKGLGVEFGMAKLTNFDGTTLVATNQEVDRFNFLCLQKVQGERFELRSERWGRARGEWKLIPERDPLRVGALVMLLANQRAEADPEAGWSARGSELLYANGDLAHVSSIKRSEKTGEVVSVLVKLKRNGEEHEIARIQRQFTVKEHPSKRGLRELLAGGLADQDTARWGEEWWDGEHKRFVLGAVRYFPLRLAYATTVHKSQGLSLDSVQVDCTHNFFGSPNMAYVAMSRARTAEGLRIVGTPEMFARRVKMDPKIKPWV